MYFLEERIAKNGVVRPGNLLKVDNFQNHQMDIALMGEFGVPMVFAKKSKSINIDAEMYVAEVESFTHKNKNQVMVSLAIVDAMDAETGTITFRPQ